MFDADAFAGTLAAALDAGPVACLQLRLKDADDDEVRRAARALMPLCHDRGVAFLVNDRPDLAAEVGADGTHIGQRDADYDAARRLVGEHAIVGVSCGNSHELALQAAEAGADYVAFGAFFATGTKSVTTPADLETLRSWTEMMSVPAVAIGGITIDNCRPLIEAGADFLAVISGVWNHPAGAPAAVAAFHQTIGRPSGG